MLTDIDYRELIEFRERHNAHGVMAVRMYEWTNPYGVVQMEGVNITGFAEKPVSRSHINAGVYAFSPSRAGASCAGPPLRHAHAL